MASESKPVDKGLLDKILDYLTENFGPNLPSNEEAIKKLKEESFKKLFPKGMPPASKPKPRPKTRSTTVEAKKGGLFTRKGAMKRNKS